VKRYVAVELYGFCKSRSEDVAYDLIVLKVCCNSMFLSVLDISAVCFVCVFQSAFQLCLLDVIYVLHICCTCVYLDVCL